MRGLLGAGLCQPALEGRNPLPQCFEFALADLYGAARHARDSSKGSGRKRDEKTGADRHNRPRCRQDRVHSPMAAMGRFPHSEIPQGVCSFAKDSSPLIGRGPPPLKFQEQRERIWRAETERRARVFWGHIAICMDWRKSEIVFNSLRARDSQRGRRRPEGQKGPVSGS